MEEKEIALIGAAHVHFEVRDTCAEGLLKRGEGVVGLSRVDAASVSDSASLESGLRGEPRRIEHPHERTARCQSEKDERAGP